MRFDLEFSRSASCRLKIESFICNGFKYPKQMSINVSRLLADRLRGKPKLGSRLPSVVWLFSVFELGKLHSLGFGKLVGSMTCEIMNERANDTESVLKNIEKELLVNRRN